MSRADFEAVLAAARDTTAIAGAPFDDSEHVGHALTHYERPRLDGGPCDICERARIALAQRTDGPTAKGGA